MLIRHQFSIAFRIMHALELVGDAVFQEEDLRVDTGKHKSHERCRITIRCEHLAFVFFKTDRANRGVARVRCINIAGFRRYRPLDGHHQDKNNKEIQFHRGKVFLVGRFDYNYTCFS